MKPPLQGLTQISERCTKTMCDFKLLPTKPPMSHTDLSLGPKTGTMYNVIKKLEPGVKGMDDLSLL